MYKIVKDSLNNTFYKNEFKLKNVIIMKLKMILKNIMKI